MYEPSFYPDVAKDLKGLDRNIRQRILDKTQMLSRMTRMDEFHE